MAASSAALLLTSPMLARMFSKTARSVTSSTRRPSSAGYCCIGTEKNALKRSRLARYVAPAKNWITSSTCGAQTGMRRALALASR